MKKYSHNCEQRLHKIKQRAKLASKIKLELTQAINVKRRLLLRRRHGYDPGIHFQN